MVTRLSSVPVFVGAGIGLQIAVAAGLVIVFRRRGWFSADGTVPATNPADRPQTTRQERWHLEQPAKEPLRP